jgi:hypothetical protein
MSGQRSSTLVLALAAAVVIVVAALLIVLPALRGSGDRAAVLRPELTALDPASLVPHLGDMPPGSERLAAHYINNRQAAKANNTDLAYLHKTGRQLGYERDFKVPKLGEYDVEVVRFSSKSGLAQAYTYFLSLASNQHLTPAHVPGLGENAVEVLFVGGAFIEMKRGRYYSVISAFGSSPHSLAYLKTLAHRTDERIRTYRAST